jgi:hypothetical protein
MGAFDSALRSPDNTNALAGNVGGQARNQEVLTPRWILEAVRESFGGAIEYDPCASTDFANWFALDNDTLPVAARQLERRMAESEPAEAARLKKLIKPYYQALPKLDRAKGGDTFVNPPFGHLDIWMRWCFERRSRVIGLWPVRPHRPWWVKHSRLAEVVMLRYDVVFVGHTQAFPAPLCLATYGCILPSLGARETGRWRP